MKNTKNYMIGTSATGLYQITTFTEEQRKMFEEAAKPDPTFKHLVHDCYIKEESNVTETSRDSEREGN